MKFMSSIGVFVFALHGAAVQADELYGESSAVALGRLFLTAEQRRSLNQRRLLAPDEDAGSEDEAARLKPSAKETTAFGLISSGDRAPLIWQDGGFRATAREPVVKETGEATDDTESPDNESPE